MRVPPLSHEQAQREQKLKELRDDSGVPKRYERASFESCRVDVAEWQATASTLRRLIDVPGMVALLGKRGTGKTHMACALVNAFCRNDRGAWYRRAMDFFLEVKATYSQSATETQRDVQKRYEKPALLVLDEMQVRSDTPWEDMVLTDLIDRRYSAEKSTVLISNQDLKAFVSSVGESVADRLNEDGGILMCNWRSLRAEAR